MGRLPERERPPDDLDSRTWYTRSEAASLLGCSVDLIRHFERKGRLHPEVDGSGYHRFSPQEVLKLQERRRRKRGLRVPRMSEGELEARAYSMYDAGKSRNDVGQTLFITSDLAQKFWERWNERYAERALQSKQQREEEDAFRRQLEDNQKRIDSMNTMFAPRADEKKR